MATAHRQPLGPSDALNVQSQVPKHNDAVYQLKKARSEVHEERRKRAEAEGSAEGWKRDVEISKKEVESLKKDLEKAKAKISRRDEMIKSLESRQANGLSPNAELERKLRNLVETHHMSKDKSQKQISSLQAENQSLQHTLSRRTEELKILKDQYSGLEIEHRQLTQHVESLKQASGDQDSKLNTNRKEIREYENEKTEWKIENHRLERHVSRLEGEFEILKSTVTRGKQREQKVVKREEELRKSNQESQQVVTSLREEVKEFDEVREENGRLQSLLEATSISYRLLYRGSVTKEKYQQLEGKWVETSTNALRWQEKAERLEGKLSRNREIIRDLQEQVKIAKDERKLLSSMVKDMLQDRHNLREEMSSYIKSYSPSDSLIPLDQLPFLPVLDMAMTHNHLSTSHLINQLTSLRQEHTDLLKEYETTRESLFSSSTTLTALQRSFAELKSSHQALEESHTPCSGLIANLQLDLSTVRDEIIRLKEEVKIGHEEMDKSNKRSRDDREALKRANEVVMRSKMAEEALDEEVKHLQEAYYESSKYEELYHDLKEQYEILESREQAAVDEAERLGLENAELVGHNNEGQKINYVEGVRREMVMIKQELASTRHLLNISNDKIIKMENEIQAYKSIDPIDSGLNGIGLGSSRTKVMRRQPENGRLTVSRSKPRNVSGPVWR
ncbi:hypothetical protein L486_01198 [Kwoniella mangroviensis CBS 10435]|uniref:Hyaluronan-mediated motility receptor C-terminal domain-containing protein n=1 Tax=Kwoniella mangroviensis CBS 10435 TaxID=1331196 RepID=A0A1B9J182_9TREE|nr:hypothetical protein L486_01198 [Kwoniella mangroviensis CBS 10435]